MSEIVERSLRLTVQAEDLTDGLFGDIAGQLEQLQQRAEQTYQAVVAAAETATDALKAAAGELPGFWQDQLQAVADTAGVAFAEVADAAMTAADSVLGSAAPVAAAWEAPLTQMAAAGETATARLVAGFDTVDGAIAAAVGGADGLNGKLKESLGAAATTVEGDAGRIQAALDGVDAALTGIAGDADGLDGKLKAALDGAAGYAQTDADEITKALSGVSTGLSEISGAANTLDRRLKLSMDGAAETMTADARKMVGSVDEVAAALGKAGLSGGTAAGEAGLVAAGGGGRGGGGIAGLAGREAAAAEKEVAAVSESFASKLKSTLGKYVGSESSGGFFSGAGSKLFMGGLTATMMPSFMNMLADSIEQIGGMQQMGGGRNPMSVSNALELSTIMTSANINPQMQARMIARFEKNLLEGTGILSGLNENNPLARPESLGLGRIASNPQQLLLGGPTETMARLFALAGVKPKQLQQMNALQQMGALFTGLHKVHNQSEQTAALQMLFGGGRGSAMTGIALLAAGWPQFSADYAKSGAAAAAASLAGVLPKNATASAANLRMGAAGLSMSLESLGIELIPVMQDFTKGLAGFTKFLADFEKAMASLLHGHINASDWKAILGDVGSVATNPLAEGYAGYRVVKGAVKNKGVGGLLRRGAEKLFSGGAGEDAAVVAEDAAKFGLHLNPALLGTQIAAMITHSSGIDLSNSTANDTSAFAQMWQKLVAPHTGKRSFGQTDAITAILQAARVYGLDPAAMLSTSFAESTLNPAAHNKSGATGIFQFLPSTWAADTRKLLGQPVPFQYASNPYVAAMVAASSMHTMGISGMHGADALRNMIGDLPGVKAGGGTGFEHPGPAGAAGDLSRGMPFLRQIQNDLSKTAAAVKRDAPKLHPPVDQALLQIVLAAERHGREFNQQTDRALKQAELFLRKQRDPFTKAGQDIMRGLEVGLRSEEGPLLNYANELAKKIGQTLRNATRTKSPSEMTAEIGADLAAGLLLGYQRGMPNVLAGVAGGFAGLTGPGLHATAAGGGGMNVTITVDGANMNPQQLAQELWTEIQRRTYDLVKLQGSIG